MSIQKGPLVCATYVECLRFAKILERTTCYPTMYLTSGESKFSIYIGESPTYQNRQDGWYMRRSLRQYKLLRREVQGYDYHSHTHTHTMNIIVEDLGKGFKQLGKQLSLHILHLDLAMTHLLVAQGWFGACIMVRMGQILRWTQGLEYPSYDIE